jgi:hypothetical protein
MPEANRSAVASTIRLAAQPSYAPPRPAVQEGPV